MGIFDNIKQNMRKKQDNKIIEKIKHSKSSQEMYDLIEQLQLDDSRMQVFKLLDANHVFDSFKEKKYDEMASIIENPYNIFTQLQNDRDKFTMLQYFYEHGINEIGFITCIGETSNNYNQILLEAMETQEYKEKALELMYCSIDFNYEPIEQTILSIIGNMQPEKREQFLQEYNFSNRMTMKLYKRYNDESLMQKSNSSIEEYLASSESHSVIRGVSKQQATKLLELYGDTMYFVSLGECVKNSSDTVEGLENMLNKYYERLKEEIPSIFMAKTLWCYDYQALEMFIEKFSKDIDEKELESALENYKESIERAEEQIKKNKENRIRDFVEHDKENPQFLYNITCKYYDAKIQDEDFKFTGVNTVIKNLPLMDRLEFARRYKNKITISEISGISEEVVAYAENLDINKFLIEYEDVISPQDIIDIINAVPFRQRIELIKVCNLDEEQKKKIIQYAQEHGEQNVSFLELAATKAELNKMEANTQMQQGEDKKYTNILLGPNEEVSK